MSWERAAPPRKPRHYAPQFLPRATTMAPREGVDPVGGPPADLATLIARELRQWRDLAKAANIKLQ
jgi:hypothetical protein